jgi:hypothetical protein
MTKLIQTYRITAWCDRSFTTMFEVEAESPDQALMIAREQVHDEPAEECWDCYPWDRFRVADADDVKLLAWAEEEVTLRDAAGRLLDACRLVVERWEHGDLAEAARACSDAIAEATGNAVLSSEARTIKIEVRGGVVQEVCNVPPGWDFEIVDHDDADEPRFIRKQLTSNAMFHTPGFFRALQNDYRIKGLPRLRAIELLSEGYGLPVEEAEGLLSGAIEIAIDEAAGTVAYAFAADR